MFRCHVSLQECNCSVCIRFLLSVGVGLWCCCLMGFAVHLSRGIVDGSICPNFTHHFVFEQRGRGLSFMFASKSYAHRQGIQFNTWKYMKYCTHYIRCIRGWLLRVPSQGAPTNFPMKGCRKKDMRLGNFWHHVVCFLHANSDSIILIDIWMHLSATYWSKGFFLPGISELLVRHQGVGQWQNEGGTLPKE